MGKKLAKLKDNVLDKVLELVDKHVGITGAILDEYVVGNDSMFLELGIADKSLRDCIEELKEDEGDNYAITQSVSVIIEHLNETPLDTDDLKGLLNVVVNADEDLVLDYSKDNNWAMVKIDNLQQREKLEAFVKAEIWPHYNEEKNY